MTDMLILLFLIGLPAWLVVQFFRLRPAFERKQKRRIDPLTGSVYTTHGVEGHEP